MKTIIILSLLIISNYTTSYLTTSEGHVWMTENLSVSQFRNGDEIFHAKTKEEWNQAFKRKTPAFCYFNNDTVSNNKSGKLYNFYAVKDERGLAPEGWHVASDEEWESLINEFGGNQKAGKQLLNNDFNFIPGGCRDYDGRFIEVDSSALFWTSTINFNFLSFNRQIFALEDTPITRGSSHHGMGMFVRCVKNR